MSLLTEVDYDKKVSEIKESKMSTHSRVQSIDEIELIHKQRFLVQRVFDAVFLEDYAKFRRLIDDDGVDVNCKDPFNKPLIIAAAKNDARYVKFLIRRGVDIHATAAVHSMDSVLGMFSEKDGDCVELLLLNGALKDRAQLVNSIVRATICNNLVGLKALIYFGLHVNLLKDNKIFSSTDNRCSDLLVDCGLRASMYSPSNRWNEYLKKTKEERLELNKTTRDSISREVSVSLLKHVRNRIIDVCVVLFSADLPPYIVLEIVDWFPNYDMVRHYNKIALINSCFESMRRIKRER